MNLGRAAHVSSRMILLLVCSDLLALFLVWVASILAQRYFVDAELDFLLYWRLAPSLLLFIAANALVGLYPGIMLSTPEELKKITQSISLTFLTLAAGVFIAKQGYVFSRAIFLMAWIGSLFLLPFFRSMVRRAAFVLGFWGYPAVILGAGKTGRALAETLALSHRPGLKAVAFLDDDPGTWGRTICGLPVLGPLKDARMLSKEQREAVAIVAMPGVSPERLVEVLEGPAAGFRRLIIIPDLFGASSLWVSAFDMSGILGLEVQQKLLDPNRQAVKRAMELILIALFFPLVVPLVALIALAIKIDSPGPVFFRHGRIGRDGKEISILKFRTMVPNADKVLEKCLAEDVSLLSEWTRNHKLSRDPRITGIGRLLRKTSLDELPQLWNVLRGDLSLVGPRPIVWAEVEKYQDGFELYKKVKPGVTGLWQISGRSSTTYAQRIRLDSYYVRNWSVWFDIYILIKTPMEVFRGRGAC